MHVLYKRVVLRQNEQHYERHVDVVRVAVRRVVQDLQDRHYLHKQQKYM